MGAPYNYLVEYTGSLSASLSLKEQKELTGLVLLVPGEICGAMEPVAVRAYVRRYSNTGQGTTTPRQNVRGLDPKDGSKDNCIDFLGKYRSEKPGTEPFPWNGQTSSTGSLPGNCTPQDIQNAYQGKGSPGDIKAALLLFASYEKTGNGIVRRKWPSPKALEDGLNDHCENRIGLDCLGFAVNFVKFSRGTKWSGTTVGGIDMEVFTGSKFAPKRLRDKLEKIAEGDIIVYLQKNDKIPQDSRHIAVIDSVTTKSPDLASKVRIAESFGGVGPQVEFVDLRPYPGGNGTYGKVFWLDRKGETRMVYIAPVDSPL